jgi:glutamyl-tRNA synthetase
VIAEYKSGGAVTRFAPSPTGRLHVGNIRTALLNWLLARKTGGRFILRLDDTDRERSTEAFAHGIEEDLVWLGLAWDQRERQSDRLARYDTIAAELRASGRLYPCYETADELERRRKRQLARGLPPVYDRAALSLTDADRARFEAEGRKPHWRFLLANHDGDPRQIRPTEATWNDLIRGPQHIRLDSLSDPVLVRADGGYLYTLASVIDDVDMGVTHVVRGEDHVTNTAVQIDIFRALGAGARLPAFAHHSLLVAADGSALSKRLGALSIEGLRRDGLEPLAVAAYCATIGTSDAVTAVRDLDELVGRFDLDKVSRAPVRFDPAELAAFNAKLLHEMPYAPAADRLAALGVGGGEAFWLAVRVNLMRFSDAKDWWQVVHGTIEPQIEDRDLCLEAARLLPPEPWTVDTWGAWTAAVRDATGRKGRALFHPLRLALTGRETGPELKLLLPLIGYERARDRLGST